MCLLHVSEEKPNPTGFGWKVFRVVANSLGERKYRRQAELYSENRGARTYKYDTWYESLVHPSSPSYNLWTENYPSPNAQKYLCGFHIALRRDDARNFVRRMAEGHIRNLVVRKVEYRGAHTSGTGAPYFPGDQVIAAEIRILPETRPKRVKE